MLRLEKEPHLPQSEYIKMVDEERRKKHDEPTAEKGDKEQIFRGLIFH